MKKEVILVPKDKCPLDVLADIGEQTKNAWIFLHQNAVYKLKHSEGVTVEKLNGPFLKFTWETTEVFPKTKVILQDSSTNDWVLIYSISSDNIAFKERAVDPEEILFLKMEE